MVTPWDLMVEPWLTEWNEIVRAVADIWGLPVWLIQWTCPLGVLLILVGLYEWLVDSNTDNEDDRDLSHLYNLYEGEVEQ